MRVSSVATSAVDSPLIPLYPPGLCGPYDYARKRALFPSLPIEIPLSAVQPSNLYPPGFIHPNQPTRGDARHGQFQLGASLGGRLHPPVQPPLLNHLAVLVRRLVASCVCVAVCLSVCARARVLGVQCECAAMHRNVTPLFHLEVGGGCGGYPYQHVTCSRAVCHALTPLPPPIPTHPHLHPHPPTVFRTEQLFDAPVVISERVRAMTAAEAFVLMIRTRIGVTAMTVVLYALSPLDIIPEAVFGPLGLVDDLAVMVMGSILVSNVLRQVGLLDE